MEKIKLNNGTEFEIIPMGINTNNYIKQREIKFISDLTYSEIEVVMTNMDNISKIEYYSSADELLKVYTDCKAIKKLSKEYSKEYEDGKFTDVYTVVLEIE